MYMRDKLINKYIKLWNLFYLNKKINLVILKANFIFPNLDKKLDNCYVLTSTGIFVMCTELVLRLTEDY